MRSRMAGRWRVLIVTIDDGLNESEAVFYAAQEGTGGRSRRPLETCSRYGLSRSRTAGCGKRWFTTPVAGGKSRVRVHRDRDRTRPLLRGDGVTARLDFARNAADGQTLALPGTGLAMIRGPYPPDH